MAPRIKHHHSIILKNYHHQSVSRTSYETSLYMHINLSVMQGGKCKVINIENSLRIMVRNLLCQISGTDTSISVSTERVQAVWVTIKPDLFHLPY